MKFLTKNEIVNCARTGNEALILDRIRASLPVPHITRNWRFTWNH